MGACRPKAGHHDLFVPTRSKSQSFIHALLRRAAIIAPVVAGSSASLRACLIVPAFWA
jgi:hypothetical protein